VHLLAGEPVPLERLQCYRHSVTCISEGVYMPFTPVVLTGVAPVATGACGVIVAATDAGDAGVVCGMSGAETAGPQGSGSVTAAGSPGTEGSTGFHGATATGATSVGGPLGAGAAGGAGAYGLSGPAGTSGPQEATGAREPGSGSTGLLGVAQVSGGYSVYRCSSESMVPVDATNLSVLFTAPASGRVLVRLNAWTAVQLNYPLIFGVLDHTTGRLLGDPGLVNGGSATGNAYVSFAVLITGLIPSCPYHFDWGYAVQGTDGSETGIIEVGLNSGPPIWCYGAPAVMEVWSA
jgi:hypothetical protein